MPTHPPPCSVRCQPRSAATSSSSDCATPVDRGTCSRSHARSWLRNTSSAGVNERSTARTCPPSAAPVNSRCGQAASALPLAEPVLPDLLLQRPHRYPEPPRGLGAVLPVAAQKKIGKYGLRKREG